MTEKIVGAQYRVVAPTEGTKIAKGTRVTLVEIPSSGTRAVFEAYGGTKYWMFWREVELITPDETVEQPLHEIDFGRTKLAWYSDKTVTTTTELPTEKEPNSLDSLAQGLNTLVTEHGMATVASALQKWVDFHSKEHQ